MTIEIANRLVELRKKSGLSQEELADKLGLSRQAVSKWERAEASPDTDNLICLAKLYGVSLDDLLNTDLSIDEIANNVREHENNEVKPVAPKIEDDEDDEDDEKEEKQELTEYWKKRHKKFLIVQIIVVSTLVILLVAAHLILSLNPNSFLGQPKEFYAARFAINYLSILIVASLIEAISAKKVCNFAFPVLAAWAYVFVGLFFNIWHPTWIVFVLIPIFYMVGGKIDSITREKRREQKYGK